MRWSSAQGCAWYGNPLGLVVDAAIMGIAVMQSLEIVRMIDVSDERVPLADILDVGGLRDYVFASQRCPS